MKNYWLQFEAYDMGFEAHLTLHWMGEQNGTQNTFLVEEWLHKNQLKNYETFVRPHAIDMFGAFDTPVVKVIVGEDLKRMKRQLEELVPSPSEYPWSPHITLKGVGHHGIFIPKHVKISNLELKSHD